MLVHSKSPEEAYSALLGIKNPFVPYRDAGYGAATYHISILDCLKGLHKVLSIGIFDLQSFDVDEYEFYEKVENGDFNWITPKFLALACPKEDPPLHMSYGGRKASKYYSAYTMDNLIRFMREKNIKTIIRLNNKTYDKQKFIEAGIEHIELYFPDGTTPPESIIRQFLEICESRPGPIAVHCKAGLGRTGSLISLYLMKHYKLTACQVISFLRIIRPGSVVGPQQNFLQAMQTRVWKMHPFSKLPTNISMWAPPTYPNNLARFGPVLFSGSGVYRPESPPQYRLQNAGLIQDNTNTAKNIASIYNSQDPYAQQLERERQETSAAALENLLIPVQPRKHLAGKFEEKVTHHLNRH